jgi:hypothetical protein
MLGGMHGVCALAVAASALSTTAAAVDRTAEAAHIDRAVAAKTGLALGFIENRGQTDPRVRYYAQGNRYAFYVTRSEVRLSLLKRDRAGGVTLALRFLGRNPASTPVGTQREAGDVNYLHGADPARRQTQLRHFRQVVYRDLWRGIDLRLREHGGVLKYDFRVRPGARAADIRLAYAGAQRLAVDRTGDLLIQTAAGTLRDSRPISYQNVAGARVRVASRYLVSGRRFELELGRYRHDRDLIIDPGIQYTTFIGGSSLE